MNGNLILDADRKALPLPVDADASSSRATETAAAEHHEVLFAYVWSKDLTIRKVGRVRTANA